VATEVKAALAKIRLVSSVIEVAYVRIESPNDRQQLSMVGSNISLGDLHDPDYQNKLLAEYLKKRLDITDQTIVDAVFKINKDTNQTIDKDDFGRNIRWRPKRFEWDNMFSYGEGNVIDFSKLKDVVGLFAANTSGKSNVLSALSFCIFDKCDREFKAGNILNVQKMGFRCKFNFEISGVDYFIERGGNSDKKGNVKVNVRFWKVENGVETELHGEGRRDTNDIIRDYLGSYDDFVLTSLSVQNVKNAGSLIDMGHTERKDLLAMFMGLTIFDKLFNRSSERLKELTGLLKEYRNDDFTKKLVEYSNALIQAESAFNEENRLTGEQTKHRDTIQQSIVDETTKLVPLESNIPLLADSEATKKKCEAVITEVSENIAGSKKQSSELETQVNLMEVEVKKMEELELSKHYKEYQQLLAQRNALQAQIEKKKVEVKHKIDTVNKAKVYKYDKNCQYCMANANDVVREATQAQAELEAETVVANDIVVNQTKTKTRLAEIEWVVSQYDAYTKLLEKRNKTKDDLTNANNQLLRSTKRLEEAQTKLKEASDAIQLYNKNKAAIENNNEVNIRIVKLKQNLANIEFEIKQKNKNILTLNGKITVFKTNIEEIQNKVQKAKAIEAEHKSHEIYVQSVCRDGIPYEVISNMVPEIEREVNNILSQIVEFHLHFEIDGKNVIPYIVYDNLRWLLGLTSGFERFISSLAIRVGLINVSNLPRPNFLVIDEGFGVLDGDNIASMQTLFSYLKTNFDFILIISHLDTLRDMVDGQIEIKKENGFSKVTFE
jgi:DNA repair exonuclease SbcCD ATPase subunit